MGHYATKGKLTEVIINNNYVGVYYFCEAIKRGKKRVNIAKLTVADSTGIDLTGGYIWKNDFGKTLETSLSGQIVTPDTSVRPPRTRTADTLTWFGPGTNCMTCHRMAAWKDTVVLDSMGVRRYSLAPPPYYPAAYMSGNEPRWFSTVTKTDFLWSVAIRTRIPSGVAPAPPR